MSIEVIDKENIQDVIDYLVKEGLVTAVIGKPVKETHIAGVLDSSGSMGYLKVETIGAYNAFVKDIESDQDATNETTMTLVTFGEGMGDVRVKYSTLPIRDKKSTARLTDKTYNPSGNTPMYDGIGKAIEELEKYDVAGKDVAFLVSIFTDGYENASRSWSQERLHQKITELQAKGNWTFTFVGANVDLSVMQQNLGMHFGNMSTYTATHDGMQVMSHNHSIGTQTYLSTRSAGGRSMGNFYEAEQTDLLTDPAIKAAIKKLA